MFSQFTFRQIYLFFFVLLKSMTYY
jgi:hypothetical protein